MFCKESDLRQAGEARESHVIFCQSIDDVYYILLYALSLTPHGDGIHVYVRYV